MICNNMVKNDFCACKTTWVSRAGRYITFFFLYTTDMTTTPASILIRDGVVVVPVLDQKTTDVFREAFDSVRHNFPEFMHTDDANGLPEVMGGFGAYGNPASFHNPFVRTLRMVIAEPVIEFFRNVVTDLDDPVVGGRWHLEMLFDRMCRRPKDSSTTAESAHRDLNPQTVEKIEGTDTYRPKANDYCFGGWIDLDQHGRDQTFTCVLGTHRDAVMMKKKSGAESGFATQERITGDITRVTVPPGHLVIFFQRILHVVHPRKAKWDSYRQFRCWRLFKTIEVDPHPLNGLDEWTRVIGEMAVPRLPSRQVPPIYSLMHASTCLFKGNAHDPIQWTARKVNPIFVQDRVCQGKVNRGRQYRIAQRYMISLAAAGLSDIYRPYDPRETVLSRPRDEWILPVDMTIRSVEEILSLDILDRETKIVRL